MTIESGQQLLHYRLVEKLGEGGMGVVWKAVDSTLDREVAIKILPEAFAADGERLGRFEHEAKVLASLNHPNIAAVYSVHEAEGLRFLAMELVRGEDLSARLARGPLPLAEALGIALQVAEALEVAHESGVIHRDLKPSNIRLTESGQAKVLDFGLAKTAEAKATDRGSLEQSPTVTSMGTVAGMILGTAAYMSPEQARGKAVDRRADIWSFGCVLYEMLTGKVSFQGDTVTDILGAIMHRDPDWNALPSGTPAGLRRLLRRCMRRDERQRLRDIGDARILIEEALAGDTDPAVPATAGAQRSRLGVLVATALVAAVLGVVGTWIWLRTGPAETSLRKFSIALPAARIVTPSSPRISPDGTHVTFVSDGRLWLRALSEVDVRPVPGTEGAGSPFWSPDSQWIGFSRGRRIEKIPVSGGEPSVIAVTPPDLQVGNGTATWDREGKIVFSTATSGLHRLSSQGGDVTTFLETGEGDTDFHAVTGLLDGKGWVFVVHQSDTIHHRLDGLKPDGTRRPLIELEGSVLSDPCYSPTGHLLFFRGSALGGVWAVGFSAERMEVTGVPFLVAADGSSPSVADDGTLAYLHGNASRITRMVWVDRKGEVLEPIGEPLGNLYPFPKLSPDETQILVAGGDANVREVWLYEAQSGIRTQFTFSERKFDMAVWHPDGRRALGYDIAAGYKMHSISLDGSESEGEIGAGVMPFPIGDGSQLLFARQKDQQWNWDVYVGPADGDSESATLLIEGPGTQWYPVLSPDEKILLYTSDESGQDEVYATTFPEPGRRWKISSDGGSWPHWRGDGKEAFYAKDDAIFAVGLDPASGKPTGAPELLFRRTTVGWNRKWPDGFDVTRDGQRFIVAENLVAEDAAPPAVVVVQNWLAEFGAAQ